LPKNRAFSNTQFSIFSGVKDKKNAFHFGGFGGIIKRKIIETGKGWLSSDGNKYKILSVNSGKAEIEYNALIHLLSKRNFNKQLNTNYSEEIIENFSFEDVVKLLKN